MIRAFHDLVEAGRRSCWCVIEAVSRKAVNMIYDDADAVTILPGVFATRLFRA